LRPLLEPIRLSIGIVGGSLAVVAVVTATSVVTSEVEQPTSDVVTLATDSRAVSEVNLVVGAATKVIEFVAGGAVEGGIECVHIHIITTTTDI